MNSYHQSHGGCRHHNGGQNRAFTFGENLGAFAYTLGKVAFKAAESGIRMLPGYWRSGGDCHCGCRDCVECLPPVYSGCCHGCGDGFGR